MNPFDAAVYLCLAVAVTMGFRAGLLRSLATIAGYVAAAPVALALAPYVTPPIATQMKLDPSQTGFVLFALFVVSGMVLAALMRSTIGVLTGERIGAVDRTAGALLGAVRIVLVAVVVVLVFDRLIPPGREPDFLKGSQLRPLLSEAGREGLRSLPPDIADTIDRLKREHGL
jgi:membrane protein required for colicin V production